MSPDEARYQLVQHFMDLHQSLGLVRCILLELGDTEALELLDQMSSGLIAPMKRLRDHLNVPYGVKEHPNYPEIPDSSTGDDNV